MPQFFIDREYPLDSSVEISGKDAHHIQKVLRLRKGDWIILSDGKGRSFRAVISESTKKLVIAKIEKELEFRRSNNPPTLAISIIRRDRFEWAIEKSVELGCMHIIPIISERSVAHRVRDADNKKLDRWRQIASEAAKQSGLPFRPVIDEPCSFDKLIELSKSFSSTILFYEGEDRSDLRSFWKSHKGCDRNLIVIGPEGGFTRHEMEQARAAGITTLSLGQQILRVETAAIAALSIWQYELGNMDILT